MKRHNSLLILMVALVLVSTLAIPSAKVFASTEMVNIRFAKGATSAVVSGDLAANSKVQYDLRAFAGQLMNVDLSAPSGVTLKVTTLGGVALKGVAGTGGSTGFRGYLPRTGTYVLTVASGSAKISYSLNVMIPQRIAFKAGTTADTLKDSLKANESHDYILKGGKDQVMEINITPDAAANSPQIIVYGVDGSVLQSGMGEAKSFRGVLPLTEDYIVSVRAGTADVAYTMNVIIPKRISFAVGKDSATFFGHLIPAQSQYYVLKANKDQTLTVDATPAGKMQLIIYGVDGTVLRSGMGEGSTFTGKLPLAQDYIIVLRAGTAAVSYKLVTTVK